MLPNRFTDSEIYVWQQCTIWHHHQMILINCNDFNWKLMLNFVRYSLSSVCPTITRSKLHKTYTQTLKWIINVCLLLFCCVNILSNFVTLFWSHTLTALEGIIAKCCESVIYRFSISHYCFNGKKWKKLKNKNYIQAMHCKKLDELIAQHVYLWVIKWKPFIMIIIEDTCYVTRR